MSAALTDGRGGRIGFLHIGKTGGTVVRQLLKHANEAQRKPRFQSFGHSATLPKIFDRNAAMTVVFFVRHPVPRFVSAFNSRLRNGRPRYNSLWTPAEATSFGFFRSPNELAEALSSDDEFTLSAAHFAMRRIQHVSQPLTRYLKSVAFLQENEARLAYVGVTEDMDGSLAAMAAKFGLPSEGSKGLDRTQSHRAPEHMATDLSPAAVENLTTWYADDLVVYDYCVGRHETMNALAADQR